MQPWTHFVCDALGPDSPNAGKAYFVADDEPVVIWDWLNEFMGRLGKKPITSKIPRSVAYGGRDYGVCLAYTWDQR